MVGARVRRQLAKAEQVKARRWVESEGAETLWVRKSLAVAVPCVWVCQGAVRVSWAEKAMRWVIGDELAQVRGWE